MAEQQQEKRGVDLDQDQFLCSVCLDILKVPVAINCGHSYCRSCIEGCWDQQEEKGQFSCPQCRETFSPRPVLRRNHMLAEVVEKLKRTGSQQVSPSASLACVDPADVACDFCCGPTRIKAIKSCLMCMASYCAAHLEPHYRFPVLQTHLMVTATTPLQEKICTKHNKLMEIYCTKDQQCICYLCTIDGHYNHKLVSAASERAVEQKQLVTIQQKVWERIQEREKELNELIKAQEDSKACTKTVLDDCDRLFAELISSMERRCRKVKKLITAQEETAAARAKELQVLLEEEINKLRRRDAELEDLLHVDDHINFIQSFQSLSGPCESPDLPPDAVVRPQRSFRDVTVCMSDLKHKLESILKDTWSSTVATVSTIDVVLPPMPKTREEFLHHCRPLSLDINSANNTLQPSQENQLRLIPKLVYDLYGCLKATRFRQVLCTEGLSDRCYWEVQWKNCNLSAAASYNDISRESEFGQNPQSWSLECSKEGYSFQHQHERTKVSGPCSNKVGVYLDYKAGTLSFYSISDNTMTLLYKVHTTFTQPLHPGLGLKRTNIDSYISNEFVELIKLW